MKQYDQKPPHIEKVIFQRDGYNPTKNYLKIMKNPKIFVMRF